MQNNNFVILAAILLVFKISGTDTKQITVLLDDTRSPCTEPKLYNVNETLHYIVKCTERVPSLDCQLDFRGQGEDNLDRYQVCIQPISYNVTDCSVSIICRFIQITTTIKTVVFNCSESPTEVCADEGEYVSLSFTRGSISSSYYSSFQLNVTAIKTFDNSPKAADTSINYGAVAGGIVAGILLISVIFVLAVISVCNWRIRGSPARCSPVQKV